MMNVRPILEHRSGSGIRAALSGLFFLLLCSLPARAGAVGGSNSDSGSGSGGGLTTGGLTATGAPGDDVTSLPLTALDPSGITLVAPSLADLRSLAITARGQGRIDLLALPNGGYAVTFAGTYLIEVDRDVLALGRVGVLFRSGDRFTDGRARLQLGDSTTVFLTPRRLVLPLGRLAQSPDVQGNFLNLGLFGPNADRARVSVHFGAERVTLFQRLP